MKTVLELWIREAIAERGRLSGMKLDFEEFIIFQMIFHTGNLDF